ncbi:MAG: Cobalamin adenosyltransferase [Thermacetogenium phaeum]|uniref:Cobalamin adenosyltransferase n=1 Tax=Thermacetogenium phaeum TaxID=85874 RepID=A0A101FHK6_9THEO|nr:MAG: Cobalamin adenosyltransferase [Thermacetogenium phaeum]
MGVLTEIELRDRVRREGPLDTISVEPETLITPAAAQYAREQGIKIVFTDREKGISEEQLKGQKKPEHYTHLDRKNLVPKTHPRIKLRGMLDLLQAVIIKTQVAAQQEGMPQLVGDLEQMLAYARQLLRAEVTGDEVPELRLFGLSEEDIREYSHHPFSKIGVNHLTPSYHMGQVIAELNYLRAVVRQVEVSACDAYLHQDGTPERVDIIKALNRLSSAVYVMECKVVAGQYYSRAKGED